MGEELPEIQEDQTPMRPKEYDSKVELYNANTLRPYI